MCGSWIIQWLVWKTPTSVANNIFMRLYIEKSEINTKPNQFQFHFICCWCYVDYYCFCCDFFFISFVTDWIFDIISFHLRHLIKKYMHCVFHFDFNELDLCFSLIKYESFVFHLIFIIFSLKRKRIDWIFIVLISKKKLKINSKSKQTHWMILC